MMMTKRKTDYIKLLYDEGTGNVLLLTDVIADEIYMQYTLPLQ